MSFTPIPGYRYAFRIQEIPVTGGGSEICPLFLTAEGLVLLDRIRRGDGVAGPQGPPGEPGEPASAEKVWPVGVLFTAAKELDPAELLGFGKWELVAKEPFYQWERIA